MSFLQVFIFSYAITVGMNNGALDQYRPLPMQYIAITKPLFVDFAAELQAGPFFVGGSIRDDFEALAWNCYDPTQDTYTIRAGLRAKVSLGLTLEAGYSHSCFHPRECYSIVEYLEGEKIAVPWFEGSLDDFYISIRGQVGK